MGTQTLKTLAILSRNGHLHMPGFYFPLFMLTCAIPIPHLFFEKKKKVAYNNRSNPTPSRSSSDGGGSAEGSAAAAAAAAGSVRVEDQRSLAASNGHHHQQQRQTTVQQRLAAAPQSQPAPNTQPSQPPPPTARSPRSCVKCKFVLDPAEVVDGDPCPICGSVFRGGAAGKDLFPGRLMDRKVATAEQLKEGGFTYYLQQQSLGFSKLFPALNADLQLLAPAGLSARMEAATASVGWLGTGESKPCSRRVLYTHVHMYTCTHAHVSSQSRQIFARTHNTRAHT